MSRRPRPKRTVALARASGSLVIEGVPGESPAEHAMRRQREAGVVEYIWRTMNDNQVCEACEALAGRRFRWDSPPPGGHPGFRTECQRRCRCHAEPIIDLTFGMGGPQPGTVPPLPPSQPKPSPDPRQAATGCAILAAVLILAIVAFTS